VTRMSPILATVAAVSLVTTLTACSGTARGVKDDASKAGDRIAAGAETVDVKTALVSDATLDADAIDVDTNAEKKTVTLRGSVPTEDQKNEAERIARQEARGYKIVNRLAVVPR
jgi:hyperosmotically inducible periplasmic protein